MPVHDRIARHAQRHPQRTAVRLDDRTLSWAQLWLHSLALYQHLRQRAPAGGVLAIATGNAITFPLAWLAATAQPFTAAIVDPGLPQGQLSEMLSRLSPGLLLVKRQDSMLQALADSLHLSWLAVDDWLPGSLCVTREPALAADFCAGVQDATPFLINFTSGTSGLPKAFVRSRRSWRSSFEHGEAIFNLSDAPSTLFPGPLSNGIGLYCLNETFYTGGQFCGLSQWQPQAVLDRLAEQRIQRLVVVPTMIMSLAERAETRTFPALRTVLSAGAKLELRHYQRARALFPQALIQEYYGASELGFIAVSTLEDGDAERTLTSVGRAFPGTTLSIRDESGRVLPDGQSGLIFINSEQIIDRYLWGDDGHAFRRVATAATVADTGYLDADGRLYLTGRRGNMIISGGNNIYLSEVEAAMKSIPGVSESIALAIDDSYLGKKVVAVVEADAGVAATLADACRSRLAKYKLPRGYYLVHRWPLTAVGKINRAELEKRIANNDISPDLTEIPAGG